MWLQGGYIYDSIDEKVLEAINLYNCACGDDEFIGCLQYEKRK